jgi:hypothetical protein
MASEVSQLLIYELLRFRGAMGLISHRSFPKPRSHKTQHWLFKAKSHKITLHDKNPPNSIDLRVRSDDKVTFPRTSVYTHSSKQTSFADQQPEDSSDSQGNEK